MLFEGDRVERGFIPNVVELGTKSDSSPLTGEVG